MARQKKEIQEDPDSDTSSGKMKVLDNILNRNKDHHYAFDNNIDYVISSGSLTLDIEMSGGIHPGIIRSSGITEGGKTSNALSFARNFQITHPEKGCIIYIKSEGRLSENMIARSGVSTDPAKWRDIPTNDYEFVTDTMRELIKNNDDFTFHIQTGWPKEVDPLSQVKILEYLLKNKTNFLKTKYLSYGPHRANVEYLLNKRNESFLSRGEQKKMSIVFWMLQVLILVQNKTKPIVLIDDVSSELDQSKIKSIIDYLTEINIQIFISDIGNIDLPLDPKKTTIFEIKKGVLKGL